MSFTLQGEPLIGMSLADQLQLCILAVSFGGARTLLEIPFGMTHRELVLEVGKPVLPPNFFRLAVGLEDVADIIADLIQGLEIIRERCAQTTADT